MKMLPKTFSKNGFLFTQIERRGNLAVFRKSKKGASLSSFETVRIKAHDGYEIAGVKIEAGECYPSSEQWGTHGFTFSDPQKALAKMAQMESAK